MENPRTTAARDHDDHEQIEGAEDAPGFQGAQGGRIARDVASQVQADVGNEDAESDAMRRVKNHDEIEAGKGRQPEKPGDMTG